MCQKEQADNQIRPKPIFHFQVSVGRCGSDLRRGSNTKRVWNRRSHHLRWVGRPSWPYLFDTWRKLNVKCSSFWWDHGSLQQQRLQKHLRSGSWRRASGIFPIWILLGEHFLEVKILFLLQLHEGPLSGYSLLWRQQYLLALDFIDQCYLFSGEKNSYFWGYSGHWVSIHHSSNFHLWGTVWRILFSQL
jgi:hypothetical protein